MIRKIERKTVINKNRRSLVKTAVKKAEIALGVRTIKEHVKHNQEQSHQKTLNPVEAKVLLVEAERQLMRAAQKGALNKKTASRKVSRLYQKMKKIAS